MTTSVKDAAAAATAAKSDMDRAESEVASGGTSVTAPLLHKLRDTWRRADLAAKGARVRAEQDRRDARLQGLTAIGAEIDELATSDETVALADAIRDVTAACIRVRELAAAHDNAVAELAAAAEDLGAEPMAAGGPRATSARVAVRNGAVIHEYTAVSPIGTRVQVALEHAMNGDPDRAVAHVRAMIQLPEAKRPDYLLRDVRSGNLVALSAELTDGMRARIRSGDLEVLSDFDVDRYMAGELA